MRHIAKLFEASAPDAEVLGQTVMAFRSNIEANAIAPLLAKYGLDHIEPEAWYLHQSWFNVLRDISLMPCGISMLSAFGRKVVETAVMPPNIDSIPKVLGMLNVIHHINLRNVSPEEGYAVEMLSDKHYLVYHNTGNPNDTIYGFISGLVERYKHPTDEVSVQIVENKKAVEKPGSVFEIKWKTRYRMGVASN